MIDKFNTTINIYDLLCKYSIKYKGKPNHKGWLNILCPFHNDHNFGSCSIHIDSFVINCWVCGKHHIKDLMNNDEQINFSFKEIEIKEKEEPIKYNPKLSEKMIYNFIHMKLNPYEYDYTIKRGFTQEFVDHFNIVRCFSFPYRDYFSVPIIDTYKNIYEVEFRKLMQYEYEQKKDKSIDDYNYINDKKVKYEVNARLKETIFNIDNLDYNEDLYVCEGFGSIPKLWTYISKNCTCVFGSQITKYQIEYLKQFKKFVILMDQDEAGVNLINTLHKHLNNFKVIDIPYEDTDEQFIDKIKNCDFKSPENVISKGLLKYIF